MEEKKKIEAKEQEKLLQEAIPIGIKEVYLAGKSIEEESKKYKIDDTAEGHLLEKTTGIGLLLSELASLAKIGTPKDIINKSKDVANLVNSIASFIADICKTCPDPILCRELKDYGQVTKNFSVQLKILAAVKSSQILEDDPDGVQSLIICSQGLAKNVTEIVKLSQIAKLKREKSSN